MSMFSGGFFGGGTKETRQTTTNYTSTADQRTVVDGSIGSMVSPGAAVAGGGAVNAAPGASVTQTITSSGFTAEDVTTLVQQLDRDRALERASVAALGSSLASGLRDQAAAMADVVAATKTPEASMMQKLLPVLLLLGLLYFLTR